MPHLLLSAAKVIVFLNIQKKGLYFVSFSDKTEFYFVFSFIWCIFVAMMMKSHQDGQLDNKDK